MIGTLTSADMDGRPRKPEANTDAHFGRVESIIKSFVMRLSDLEGRVKTLEAEVAKR